MAASRSTCPGSGSIRRGLRDGARDDGLPPGTGYGTSRIGSVLDPHHERRHVLRRPNTATITTDAPPQSRRWLVVTLGVLIVALLGWLAWSFVAGGDEFADEAEAAAAWVAAEFDEPAPGWADFGPGVYADIDLGLTAVGTEEETADAALDSAGRRERGRPR